MAFSWVFLSFFCFFFAFFVVFFTVFGFKLLGINAWIWHSPLIEGLNGVQDVIGRFSVCI
jgi:hypothetical protein